VDFENILAPFLQAVKNSNQRFQESSKTEGIKDLDNIKIRP
jgi:hypothetical protein